MKSCVYEGTVRHRRSAPVHHAFQYSIFMMYLDLAELRVLFHKRWLWSARRPNVAWFSQDDHLGDPQVPLDHNVRDLVEAKTGHRPAGPIRLLTHLRYFGYGFNPVSFYFCFDSTDSLVETIVAEVTNTPWGEQHCYVLGKSLDEGIGRRHRMADQRAPTELVQHLRRRRLHPLALARGEDDHGAGVRGTADGGGGLGHGILRGMGQRHGSR